MKPGTLEHALHVALLAAASAPDDPGAAAAVEAARVALVQKWDAYAWHQAHKWFRRTNRGELEDYRSAAQLGLWEAAKRFEPARGHVFGTYAGWWILRYVKQAAVGAAAGGFHVPDGHGFVNLAAVAFGGADDDGDGTPFEQRVPQPETHPGEDPPDAGDVWAAVDRVVTKERERRVLRLRFRDGKSLVEAGAALGGISKERVRQIEARALDRLRDRPQVLKQFLDVG